MDSGLIILQIIPRRIGEPNGVADHASVIAAELEKMGTRNMFLCTTRPLIRTPDRWETIYLEEETSSSLLSVLQLISSRFREMLLILHFSGYGYQKRGVPFWLVKGLSRWRLMFPGGAFVTIFHELYATGRPWQSSFWLSAAQKLIARQILGLSSAAITNTAQSRDRLNGWNSEREVLCLPVPSNVGEPTLLPGFGGRDHMAVVFGLAGVEDRIFGRHHGRVSRTVRRLDIERIIDIGPRAMPMPSSIGGVPVIAKGPLPAEEVSNILRRAKFGLLAYPFELLGKSGVFAAYASHGVVPIVFSEHHASEILRSGLHFIDGLQFGGDRVVTVEGGTFKSIQADVNTWYKTHSTSIQARAILELWRSIQVKSDLAVSNRR